MIPKNPQSDPMLNLFLAFIWTAVAIITMVAGALLALQGAVVYGAVNLMLSSLMWLLAYLSHKA